MAVYSNTDILQAIKDETIICLPFNKQHVSEASLDFTLGYYYYRQPLEYIIPLTKGRLSDILKVR